MRPRHEVTYVVDIADVAPQAVIVTVHVHCTQQAVCDAAARSEFYRTRNPNTKIKALTMIARRVLH